MNRADLTDEEYLSFSWWQGFRDRLFYRTNGQGSYWAWAGTAQLDLTDLILQFGKLAPAFFQLQACDGHVAIRLFDDVVLIGIAQITPESWACVHTIYTAAHGDAVHDLRMCADVTRETSEPEVRDVAASVH